MRTFSSYGPVDTDLHYYVPRILLVDQLYQQLYGDAPNKGGHYITVWAPPQTGKTWLLQQVAQRLRATERLAMRTAKFLKHPTLMSLPGFRFTLCS